MGNLASLILNNPAQKITPKNASKIVHKIVHKNTHENVQTKNKEPPKNKTKKQEKLSKELSNHPKAKKPIRKTITLSEESEKILNELSENHNQSSVDIIDFALGRLKKELG